MAKRPTTAEAPAEIKRNSIKGKEWSVENARYFEKYVFYAFTLKLDGMTFYNMKVLFNKEDEGFLAEPSEKGADGKYYKSFYLNLDNESQEEIINEVFKACLKK